MRMTTIVNKSNSEISTPTSYVSHWIAQSHHAYQKKANEFYSPASPTSSSSSSCDFRTASNQTPPMLTKTTHLLKSHTTTWQAQAKTRLNAIENSTCDASSTHLNNHDLQEKLSRVRALLDIKKQRLCRHFSFSSSSSSTAPDQVLPTTLAVGEQPSPPLQPPQPTQSSSILALENVYLPHHEHTPSNLYTYHSSSILPCLMEESPSDSGLSDGTKTNTNDDIIESPIKNAAMIDLSKPLCKEEMLAIIQILRELWKKQFGSDMPDSPTKSTVSLSHSNPSRPLERGTEGVSYLSKNHKSQYRSTPALNKLSAELTDIKNKLKRFSKERSLDEQPKAIPIETKPISQFSPNIYSSIPPPVIGDNTLVFIPLGDPLTTEDLVRMQAKKELLIRRQIHRREEQLIRKNQRLTAALERQNEHCLYEEYTAQRRLNDDRRRKTILQAHLEQKRLERDPPSTHDYYFAAARNRNRLKRKASMQSFVSFDDEASLSGSTFDLFSSMSGKKSSQTPKRSATRFDFLSPSLTASTTASRSKMNRAASICNLNGHYESFSSLNSKATMPILRSTAKPSNLFGGSLMNISMMNNKKPSQQSFPFLNEDDDDFDLTIDSPLTASLTSIPFSTLGASRRAGSQVHLSTKSNKQSILNALKNVVLAGPANERQRDVITREIESSEARHFTILFRDHRLQFRAVYMYIPGTDVIEKLHGIGPNIITEIMVERWFKYNSGCKRFNDIPIRHFSIQCDAIVIHNEFWQKKLLMHMNKLH